MKKSLSIVIWGLALIALLAAAYTYYEKNKVRFAIPPGAQNTPLQNSTTGDAAADKPAAQTTTTDSTTASEKIMAPDFTLKDLDGKEVKLSDYEGKIIILNFWAVWCKFCIQEMPDLNELHKELEQAGDAVLLAVDVQETEEVVRNYLESENITVRVLMDENGSVAGIYGIEGYPTTFVINADGSLYTYIPGATDIETLRAILEKVRNGEPLR